MFRTFLAIVLLAIVLLISPLPVQAYDDPEYQEYYYISLDSNGVIFDGSFDHKYIDPTIETSGGEGLGWYYYPASDRYMMWFYNGPYDSNGNTDIEFNTFIATVNASLKLSYEVTLGWTNENWTDCSAPPMPADLPTLTDETTYLYQGTQYSATDRQFKEDYSYEPGSTTKVRNYRPAWIYVSASGHNFWTWRWVGLTNSTGSSTTSGACCNTDTGDCYITTSGSCTSGYTYLGDGTTCSSCTQTTSYDYGDAPETYPVLLDDNGARHAIGGTLFLGDDIDADSDGSPGTAADSDSSDDGVTFLTELNAGQTAFIQVNSTTTGILNAWIDYNADGDWEDGDEQIATDTLVDAGNNILSFDIPSTAIDGSSYARFRLSSTSGLEPGGTATDGEVEDYLVILVSDNSSTSTAVDPCDQFLGFVSQPSVWTDSNTPVIIGLPQDSLELQGPIILDDWTYTGDFPVQGIRWWGTFSDWTTSTSLPDTLPDAFQISIWSSDSSGQPDVMLWEMSTNQWIWAYSGQLQDIQGLASDQAVFEFTVILSQDEWFDLGSELADQYWIGIAAEYDTLPTESWSWLAQATVNDEAALQINLLSNGWPADFDSYVSSSSTVEYPTGTSWDMAFELISQQSNPSSNILGDLNGDGVIDDTDLSLLMQLVVQ